jgi:hypothetical protein
MEFLTNILSSVYLEFLGLFYPCPGLSVNFDSLKGDTHLCVVFSETFHETKDGFLFVFIWRAIYFQSTQSISDHIVCPFNVLSVQRLFYDI